MTLLKGKASKPTATPRAPKPSKRGGTQPVRTVAIMGPERTITLVTAKGTATGPLNDIKTLVRKVGAKGRTAVITPLHRALEIFEGTELDLQAALAVQRTRVNDPHLGGILVQNKGRKTMLRATLDGPLTQELAAMRGAGLNVVMLTGLIESAAHYDQCPQLILHQSELTPHLITLAVNTDTVVDIATTRVVHGSSVLDSALTLAATVISEEQLTGDLTIVLLGTLTQHEDEIRSLLDGDTNLHINTVALTTEQAARLLINHPSARPASLGALFIPVGKPNSLKDFIPHLAVGLPLALGVATITLLTSNTAHETERVRADTAVLETQAQEGEALRRENDALESSINQARQLASDRGTLATDLRNIALTLAEVGATVSSINGPGAQASATPAFDGKAVRATYTVAAQVRTPSAAEELISVVNMGRYAANVQSIECDEQCAVTMQLGLTDPIPPKAPTPTPTPTPTPEQP